MRPKRACRPNKLGRRYDLVEASRLKGRAMLARFVAPTKLTGWNYRPNRSVLVLPSPRLTGQSGSSNRHFGHANTCSTFKGVPLVAYCRVAWFAGTMPPVRAAPTMPDRSSISRSYRPGRRPLCSSERAYSRSRLPKYHAASGGVPLSRRLCYRAVGVHGVGKP